MSEVKDSAIELFGRKIPLSEEVLQTLGSGAAVLASTMRDRKNEDKQKVVFPVELKQNEPAISYCLNISNEHEQEASTENAEEAAESRPGKDHKEAESSDQSKILKKPDKILPCPRCSSMDTKFCYYNNYNVNQPRYFCKNCQRYWTAGGTMRNVPVGAGRRKNKNSCPEYNHTSLRSDLLTSALVENSDLTQLHPLALGPHASEMTLNTKGTDLKFVQDAPTYVSLGSVSNLAQHKKSSEEPLCLASASASSYVDNGTANTEHTAMQGYFNGVMLMHHLQCFPGAWAYPLNPGWNNVTAASAASFASGFHYSDHVPDKEKATPAPVPWNPSHSMASAFYAPAFPFPLVPASFWGSIPCWNPAWVESCNGLLPFSFPKTNNYSENGSPTLEKHSRGAGLDGEKNTEKSLWFPKTLRIDDPDEAARSSIFATLGIKPSEAGRVQPFQSKFGNGEAAGSSQVLHANPAALSRSETFQETI